MPRLNPSKSAISSWGRSFGHREEDDDADDVVDDQEIPLLDITSRRTSFQNVSLLPNVHSIHPIQGHNPLQSSPSFQAPTTSRNHDSPSSSAFHMRSRTAAGSNNRRSQSPEQQQDNTILSSINPSFILVDIPIESNDTLPSFAIKYHVTTSELKRLNNMFHDQDFHSRQYLKVPIHKYGILAERFLTLSDVMHAEAGTSSHPQQQQNFLLDLSSQSNSPSMIPSTPDGMSSPVHPQQDEVMMRGLKMNTSSFISSQSRAAKLFLQNMDIRLQHLTSEAMGRQQRDHLIPQPEEAGNELLNNRQRIQALQTVEDGLGCDSADCGINLKALLFMLICLTIVLPAAFLIYKLYCLHHPDSCPTDINAHASLSNYSLTSSHDHS